MDDYLHRTVAATITPAVLSVLAAAYWCAGCGGPAQRVPVATVIVMWLFVTGWSYAAAYWTVVFEALPPPRVTIEDVPEDDEEDGDPAGHFRRAELATPEMAEALPPLPAGVEELYLKWWLLEMEETRYHDDPITPSVRGAQRSIRTDFTRNQVKAIKYWLARYGWYEWTNETQGNGEITAVGWWGIDRLLHGARVRQAVTWDPPTDLDA